MWDYIAVGLVEVFVFVVATLRNISVEDAVAIGTSFVVASSVILVVDAAPKLARWSHARAIRAARTYVEELFDGYARRFTRRGFLYETCKYSLWLAFALWLHAFLVLTLWPTWTGLGIILLSALAVVLTMSVLGFRLRGPARPGISKFGIFYEPSFALVSTFLVGKLPDLASRGFWKLLQVVGGLVAV